MKEMSEIEKYIEDLGLFYERFGLPKMSGRILGYLTATSNEQVSFDEILAQLKASKGSISGNLSFLVKQQLIEKLMITGDRKSYYRFSTQNVFKIIEQKISSVAEVKKMFIRANEINQNTQGVKHQDINEIVEFYDFLELEIPKLKEKWLKHQQKKSE